MRPLPKLALLLALALLTGCVPKRFRLQRDRLFLTNGEVETGKVLTIDSQMVRLQRPDRSERLFPKIMVDSIGGLSHKTRFVAVGAVGGTSHFYSKLLDRRMSDGGFGYQVRIGRMVKGRRARYFQFERLALDPFWQKRWGLGWQYYFYRPYFEKKNAYAGLRWDVNRLYKNGAPHSSFALTMGGEAFFLKKIRVFAEGEVSKNLSAAQPRASFFARAGVRVAFREHSLFYERLNQKLK